MVGEGRSLIQSWVEQFRHFVVLGFVWMESFTLISFGSSLAGLEFVAHSICNCVVYMLNSTVIVVYMSFYSTIIRCGCAHASCIDYSVCVYVLKMIHGLGECFVRILATSFLSPKGDPVLLH